MSTVSTIPTVSEAEIRARVGEQSFQRGQHYFRDGAIFDARRQGMTLEAVNAERPSGYGYRYYGNSMALEVAKAAEETRPRAALEMYQRHAEGLIAQQGRQNYQQACRYLATVRALYERLGESDAWARYIADLRERNRRLRALMEELAAARM